MITDLVLEMDLHFNDPPNPEYYNINALIMGSTMGWHIATSGPDPYAQCAGLSQMLIFSITVKAEHVGSRSALGLF